MITVFKYPISLTDEPILELPQGYEFLHFGPDPTGAPCIWCRVNTSSEMFPVHFRLAGTGHPVDEDWQHLGSAVFGPFVFHLFEEDQL